MRALLLLLFLTACGRFGSAPPATVESTNTPPAGEALTQVSESGPVKATVSIWPKKPRLGDSLTLTLTVESQPLVAVEMPPFGEALGRFSIVSFTPRSETASDGTVRQSQRYVLEPPMSGRQRIPALRIEFVDHRPGQLADAGAAANEPRELLTDELGVEIESVLPQGSATAELQPLRGPLDESVGQARRYRYLAVPLGLLLLGVGWQLISRRQRRRQQQVQISAYDVAVQRLAQLERRGWPSAEQADGWYVELSDAVRRYIEDRYGVRAPELTTEEFLREARAGLALVPANRELLEAFLSTCDRVKFAAYRPAESESQQALAAARRFLDDTRIIVAEVVR